MTDIPVKNGFLYLGAIMDGATRKILSWRLSKTLDASFCVEALGEAIARYGKPEIMNTDQGSQYTGAGWITTLTNADIKISMDGRGRGVSEALCIGISPCGLNWSFIEPLVV